MRRATYVRNLVIAFAVVLAVLLIDILRQNVARYDVQAAEPQAPLQQTTFWVPTSQDVPGVPGRTAEATYTLKNTSSTTQTYNLDIPDIGIIPGAAFTVAPNKTVIIGS